MDKGIFNEVKEKSIKMALIMADVCKNNDDRNFWLGLAQDLEKMSEERFIFHVFMNYSSCLNEELADIEMWKKGA